MREALGTPPEERTTNPSRLLSGLIHCSVCYGPIYAARSSRRIPATILERRDILRRSIPGGFLKIGPGKTGVRGFQRDRVLDIAKLEGVPAADIEIEAEPVAELL